MRHRQAAATTSLCSAGLCAAFRLLWSVVDRTTKTLFAATFLLVLGAACTMALVPLFLKLVVDGLDAGIVGGHGVRTTYALVGLVSAHCVSRSLAEFRDMYFGRADRNVQRVLSAKLARHVLGLPLRYHLQERTGALAQTLANGLVGYRMMLHHVLLTGVPIAAELATVTAVLIALRRTDFLVIMCLSIFCYALVFRRGVARVGQSAAAASGAVIDAHGILTDSIINFETIKCFTAESGVCKRFDAALEKAEKRWIEMLGQKLGNGLAVATVFGVSLAASMFLALTLVRRGDMTVGDFVLVNAYILQITRPVEALGYAIRDVAQGMAYIRRLLALFRWQGEFGAANQMGRLPSRPPALRFERVGFAYRDDHPVLHDVSFDVPSGRTVGIVGESGSGKTTLIRLLLRLLEPKQGQIYMDDRPLPELPITALRESIAVIPQDVCLFNESIAYNIGIGKPGCSTADIVRAGKLAHVHDFVLGLPEGYDTEVGERGIRLSGGERQRIAIARAVIRRPRVLIFDEATSALDSRREREIFDAFAQLVDTTTTLIIAHRLSSIASADDILVMKGGRIIECGSHSNLLRQNGLYAALWHVQHG